MVELVLGCYLSFNNSLGYGCHIISNHTEDAIALFKWHRYFTTCPRLASVPLVPSYRIQDRIESNAPPCALEFPGCTF